MDVKPDNIYTTKQGIYKLGDFGLATCRSLQRNVALEEGDSRWATERIMILGHLGTNPLRQQICSACFQLIHHDAASRNVIREKHRAGDDSVGFRRRYIPLEVLNDDFGALDRADMFMLGASLYELAIGTQLPTGTQLLQLTCMAGQLMSACE